MLGSSGLSKASDNKDVAIVIPAEGPNAYQNVIIKSKYGRLLTIFLNSTFGTM